MREICIFEKNNLKKLDLKGVKSDVLQFHTEFTHVSRRFLAFNRKQKNSLGKTVLEMWSQICGQIAMVINKVTLKKSAKKVKTHKT